MIDVQSFDGTKVLITGGLGFIGSNLARRLVELGARVTLVDSLVPEYGNLLTGGFKTGPGQYFCAMIQSKFLVQGQDYLFNLAGQTSHMDSMLDPFTDLEINSRAQLAILEACRHANPGIRVVFASTRQIYGRPHYLPVDEKHPLHPVDVNGINKMSGEGYHILYHDAYGIRTTALRLTNTYGPRMRVKDARQTFLGIWIRLIIEAKPFEVWGGEQLRDFTYVDDAVEAMLLAATRPEAIGRIYNLGGEGVISLKELAALLVRTNGTGEFLVRSFPEEQKIDIGDFYRITD
jgi:nucleoside-diphosphate-sugar epimerase